MTVYNQDPATRGQVRNLLKTIPEMSQRYHGFEAQFNTRLDDVTLFGGVTIGNNYGDQDAGDWNNPNVRINNKGDIGFDSPYQIRAGFSYTMPADVRLAGSLRSASGLPQQRIYVVTTAVVPGLTQVTQNVQVAERGEYRYAWVNLLDLRVAKSFQARSDAHRAHARPLQRVQQQRRHQRRADPRPLPRPSLVDRDGAAAAARRAHLVLDGRTHMRRRPPVHAADHRADRRLPSQRRAGGRRATTCGRGDRARGACARRPRRHAPERGRRNRRRTDRQDRRAHRAGHL